MVTFRRASTAVFNLSVVPVRPAIVGSSPDSIEQSSASIGVNLTGGYYVSGKTTVQVNGQAVGASILNSRQLSATIPAGTLATPGLYPIVVQNSDAQTAGQPSISAVNLAVTPSPNPAIGAPTATIGVGTSPSAVAMDYADRIAVVANTGSNSVTLVNLITNAVAATIAVGKSPTSVAVDDLLADPVALVLNSTDQTVSAIDLKTSAVAVPLSVSIGPVASSPVPYAIGENPLTHRAVVVYKSTNQATVLNVSLVAGTPTVAVVQQVGGSLTSFGTGATPGVAIDPRLNWAVITPGGTGPVNIIDLGRAVSAGDPAGRAPQVVAGISLSTSIQGIGINPETHSALLTDPESGILTTLSLLDFTVGAISFPTTQFNYIAAAASSLENVGIAVNSVTQTASIVDLGAQTVLQTISGLGSNSQAVAVDPGSNEAVVVNQGGNSVSIVSLSQTVPAINPLQIVESMPAITFTSVSPADLSHYWIWFYSGISSASRRSGAAHRGRNFRQRPAHDCHNSRHDAGLGQTLYCPGSKSRRWIGNTFECYRSTAIHPAGGRRNRAPVGVAADTEHDLAVVTIIPLAARFRLSL